MREKPIIFLDMDEVLVDFIGGALAIHGYDRLKLSVLREPGTWDIIEPLGLNLADFWDPITKAGVDFWAELRALPWATKLVGLVEEYTDEWYVVTSPSSCPTSYTGKVQWLKGCFGSRFDRFFISPHKELLAGPNRILIDDRGANIDKFVEAGGLSCLFPSRGNLLHRLAKNPLRHVKERLNELCI